MAHVILVSEKRIRQLQQVVQGVSLLTPQQFLESLDCVVHEKHWHKYKTRDGNSFKFFEQWVAYPQPEGLGVDSQHGAEYFRDLLLGAGRIGMWASIMEYISVKPGRRENLVDDDSFRPYYHVSTASNAIDRMLRSLKLKRPELYALVLDGQLTLREAAKEAGLIKDNSGWAAAVAKLLTGFKGLDGNGQIELLDLLWSRMEPIDRRQFIATHRVPE